MKVLKIDDHSYEVEGNFNIEDNDELGSDLQSFYEFLKKNIDFNDKVGAFVGFAETPNGTFIKTELEESNMSSKKMSDNYLLIVISSELHLKKALKMWADEAGGGGLFSLLVCPKQTDLEELAGDYIQLGKENVNVDLLVDDASDGEKNVFFIKSKSALLN